MLDFGRMQAAVVEWQNETFPDATAESCAKHLLSEAHEVLAAVNGGKTEEVAAELGDVVLLAIAVANQYGIELEFATAQKFSTAKLRRYQFDPNLGFAVHVREAADGD